MELCDHEVNYGYMTCWESSSVQPESLYIDQVCWRYRGEGNANIVIALADEVTIIRLSKNNVSGVSWVDNQKKKVERQVIFATHVFAPLLGANFVAKVHAVYIAPDQIVQLNECLQRLKLRPGHRLHKELKVPYATAHFDFARILNYSGQALDHVDYCVEIKPKKGWWVKSKNIGYLRPDLCTYCLNQYHQLKKGKIYSRSNYCPLELFSGKPALMVQAVISLLSNPQNNLRIFRNGTLVYGDAITSKDTKSLSRSLDAFIQEWTSSKNVPLNSLSSRINGLNSLVYLICLALLKPQAESTKHGVDLYFQLKQELQQLLLEYSIIQKNNGHLVLNNDEVSKDLSRKKCCTQETSELPDGSALSRILNAQKLEESDVLHVKRIYRKICPVHANLRLLKNNFTAKYLTYEDCPSNKCISGEVWLDEIQTSHLSPKELLSLQRNLLAATVRDCSIMMTLSHVSTPLAHDWPVDEINESILQDLYKGFHHSRVGIVDLDPKCISAIVKHNVREGEMLKAYYSTSCE